MLRIGHSGAGVYAPPNTLRSIDLAIEFGMDMVEFDVRRCRDALVLIHDKKLGMNTIGRGNVRDHTLEELRKVDLGEGETIPTLEEATCLIKGRAQMNIDLKEAGYEEEVLEVLRKRGVLGDVIISSLIPESLRTLKRLAPEVLVGLSYPPAKPYLTPFVRFTPWLIRLTMPWRIAGIIAAAHADALMLRYQFITSNTVTAAHLVGYRVFAWTVDDLLVMRQLKKIGIDGIASNRPDLLADL